jgi:hypothetical protein
VSKELGRWCLVSKNQEDRCDVCHRKGSELKPVFSVFSRSGKCQTQAY